MTLDIAALDLDGAAKMSAALPAGHIGALAGELEPHFASGPGARLFGLESVARLCGKGHPIGN